MRKHALLALSVCAFGVSGVAFAAATNHPGGGPNVSITSSPVSKSGLYTLTGRVGDDVAITHLSWSVNGEAEHALSPQDTFNVTITLKQGGNDILVKAIDKAGRKSSAMIVINFEPPIGPGMLATSAKGRAALRKLINKRMKFVREELAKEAPTPTTQSAGTSVKALNSSVSSLKKTLASLGASTAPGAKSTTDATGGKFFQLRDYKPPMLLITSGNGTYSTRYLLTGIVTDKTGIRTLSYVVGDGNPHVLKIHDGDFAATLALAHGANMITVLATDNAGQTSTAAVRVTASPFPVSHPAIYEAHKNPSRVKLNVKDTVAALSSPTSAERGVWSLLANLGIGVYTGHGVQVMPGSETGEKDFWLYAFEIQDLAKMAQQPAGHVSDLAKALNEWGFPIKPDQLVALYRDMFASRRAAFTARLFHAWHVPLGKNPRLTRLQAWLLLISLLPPNGSHTLFGHNDNENGFYRFASRIFHYLIPVAQAGTTSANQGKFHGNGAPSNYAMAAQYGAAAMDKVKDATFDELKKRGGSIEKLVDLNEKISKVAGFIGKIKDAATMVELYANIRIDMDVSPASVHMVHDTQYEEVGDKKVTITVTVNYDGPKPGSINYGVLSRVKLDLPKPGPLKDAGVRFRFDDFLKKHGYSYDPNWTNRTRLLTNSQGKAVIQYETKKERPREAQKSKYIAHGQGAVVAEVDLAGAAHQFFNPFASLEILSDFLDLYTMSYPITVTWHILPGRELDLRHLYESGELVTGRAYTCDGMHWKGSLKVKGSGDDYTLESSGKFQLVTNDRKGRTSVATKGDLRGEYKDLKFVDNLLMVLEITPDQKTARVILGSILNGRIFVSGASGIFASLYPTESYHASLKTILCNSRGKPSFVAN